MMRTPSLKFIKTFLLAAKRQGFKAAADELYITASAVSHQVKALEEQLGLQLFVRGPHSLTLTDAGAFYREQLDSLFSRLELVTEQVRTRFTRNVIRLQAPPLFASELLLPRLAAFSAAQPNTDLQIVTDNISSEQAADADVAILVGSGHWPELQSNFLFPQIFVPACAPGFIHADHIHHANDLNDKPLIVHKGRVDLWQQWAGAQGIEPLQAKQLIRFDSMSAVVQAAEQGVGIALVSAPLAARQFSQGRLLRILDAELTTGEAYFLTISNSNDKHNAVRALSHWLLEEFMQA
ncbi:MAG: LysR substrate-binding domain-containing protein [Steroidobacteraceae bacterium]